MNTPRWLRVERQKRAEEKRWPMRTVFIPQESLTWDKRRMSEMMRTTNIWNGGVV